MLCDVRYSGLVSEAGSGPTQVKGCIMHVCMLHRHFAATSQTGHQKMHVIIIPQCLPALKIHTEQAEATLFQMAIEEEVFWLPVPLAE